MAATQGALPVQRLETTCYETALCVIPPLDYCHEVDKLRELYDKGYGRWPAHINLLYPFVAIEQLPRAKELLQAKLATAVELRVRLNDAGYFAHRQGHTVFTSQRSSDGGSALGDLRNTAMEALGLSPAPCQFHLTIGQSADLSLSSRDFLLDKASRLPHCEFGVHSLAILIRERKLEQDKSANHMKLWDTIDLISTSGATQGPITEFWTKTHAPKISEKEERDRPEDGGLADLAQGSERSETTYSFNPDSGRWESLQQATPHRPEPSPKTFEVSTYNVLVGSEYPPSRERYSSLLHILTSAAALADILVLEEVSDDFLTDLLSNEDVRSQYSFTSHGPSTQPEIGPLPSLRNIVILSRFPFDWTWLPFQRRHKGAAIAKFRDIGIKKESIHCPLVFAGIHLTSGLTDQSVAAKQIQVSSLLNYLKRKHAFSPWIVAGDFNITTSALTIETAIEDKSITQETLEALSSIRSTIQEAAFLDSWSMARVQAADGSANTSQRLDANDLFEGEEGATFDPRENQLAAESSGSSRNRPQRYDKILLRDDFLLQTSSFNIFGYTSKEDLIDDAPTLSHPVPSDHYGIRASVEVYDGDETAGKDSWSFKLSQLQIKNMPANLTDNAILTATLAKYHMFPSKDEINERELAFSLLKDVLSGTFDAQGAAQSHMLLAIVPVGSYALNVWTTASDIDCLCIGNISSKTFFKLARQRIRKATAQGIRIVRKVEAHSGTLLELSVKGIHTDLHYCPATAVVERWANISQLPHTDQAFDLPILSLRKLKPYRDLDYIQRTLPDTGIFRLAHRCIKLWASQNGIYSARFGYLGGIHITLMLSFVCKCIAYQVGSATVEDVVATFFHYFANIDWKNNMVYDPFFHKGRPRYQRTAREPMVILGHHVPNANVAHTSTVSGLEVLTKEFKAAERRLSESSMTWEEFFSSSNSNDSRLGHTYQFLTSFHNYVRIDIQYWGRTLSKGRSLVGWLESRCLLLVVDIKRVLPNLEVRIWPARFASMGPGGERDYQGCYLIGLSRNSEDESTLTKSDRQAAKDSLVTVFKRFEQQLHSDEKYYDAASSWIGVDLAKPSDLGALQVDDRDWGDPTEEETDSDSDDEGELEAVSGEEEDYAIGQLPARTAATHFKGNVKKLRPASDILNRLRWDPNLDLGDYIVGYEDRFLGARETVLEKWKTEQTDEEFIPQHRILYFKRKSDGVVVWERKSRIDRIFGSGVGGGGQPEL